MKTFKLEGTVTGHLLGNYDEDGAHLDSILTVRDTNSESEIQIPGNHKVGTKFTITIEERLPVHKYKGV